MSAFSRRGFIGSAAAAGVVGMNTAGAGDVSFQNNVPDELLAGHELPTFKFELEKGDVGYIPQGYGHSIENVGEGKSRVLIGFNTGHYEAIDLSQWIAGNLAQVLATNFGKPESLFAKFPRERGFIAPTEPRSQPEREVH